MDSPLFVRLLSDELKPISGDKMLRDNSVADYEARLKREGHEVTNLRPSMKLSSIIRVTKGNVSRIEQLFYD